MALVVILCAVAVGESRADDGPVTLYHVQDNTFGCADPGATHLLSNPSEPRMKNAAWLKSIVTAGRCVSVTPRSPWKLIARGGGVALMEYVGNVGPPGSYYIGVDQLVDATGHHPEEAPPGTATPPANGGATDNASSQPHAKTTNQSSETALAPTYQPAASPLPATTGSAIPKGNWTTTDVFLLLVAISAAGLVGYFFGRRAATVRTGDTGRSPPIL